MKPLIGISSQYDHEPDRYSIIKDYISFLENLGALAVLLPPFSLLEDSLSLLEICDGLIIPGGDDTSPVSYHETLPSSANTSNLSRDRLEIALVHQAIQLDMPYLGICRGMQLANVALRGTLFLDVPKPHLNAVDHWQNEAYEKPSHAIALEKESPLMSIVQTATMMVNSMHHQGVQTLSPELKIAARADDGLIEAFYHPKLSFFWGVQWHPEYLIKQPSNQAIGKAFVSACKQYASTEKLQRNKI